MKEINRLLINEGIREYPGRKEMWEDLSDKHRNLMRVMDLKGEENTINRLVIKKDSKVCEKYQTSNCILIPYPNKCDLSKLKVVKGDNCENRFLEIVELNQSKLEI